MRLPYQVLFGTGDVLAQQLVDQVGIEKHDFARTGRMVLYGGGMPLQATCKPYNARSKKLMVTRAFKNIAIFGPGATTWYKFMQRSIVFKNPKLTLVARVCADQTLFTPTHLTCFLSSMAILEGNDPLERLRTTFGTAYKTNLMLWPWVQAANFTFVPLEHRVLVVNLVSLGTFLPLASLREYCISLLILNYQLLGWNCILSLMNNIVLVYNLSTIKYAPAVTFKPSMKKGEREGLVQTVQTQTAQSFSMPED
ncbi:integral membrane protein, Mpv17/PMP22 family, putative [Trichophyton verrucosum HKI 0517]|uniref:Integral membrane protein, Mpv17/PMP22 family, putative n=1 Tax=Trichophyton verrucosum (strain HKI 0517) TaxID=663202 RepID=D4D164_TRIVH|nr:integral membrane protein, Mpv17/PMP22 family, putative [Trichophyton verrucosum HKI 0517]EFE44396.1 integral membrane protein, Mpv17/PMP22 family, putative [Trichophyton verrucosum HKI 0517]